MPKVFWRSGREPIIADVVSKTGTMPMKKTTLGSLLAPTRRTQSKTIQQDIDGYRCHQAVFPRVGELYDGNRKVILTPSIKRRAVVSTTCTSKRERFLSWAYL